jgi:hypothetical protein
MKPQVLVAQPIYGWVPAEAAMSFTQMVSKGTHQGYVVGIGQTSYGILSEARNILVRQVLAHNTPCTHVLFVDSDMLIPENTVERLLHRRKSIVSALYFMRRAPHLPVAIKTDQARDSNEPAAFYIDYPEGLSTVASAGLGCCLIETQVLKDIAAKYKDDKWFSFEQNEGEDIFFCKRARSVGHTVYLDADVKCGHLADVVIHEGHFRAANKGMISDALSGSYTPPV